VSPRVYVDPPTNAYGRMMLCHMMSPDLDALHAMADRIRVQRRWFQDPRTMRGVSRPHYDICKSKRALALTCGAVEADRYQMAAIGAIVQSIFFGADRDPLRFFTGERRERMRDWLESEGWRV
jgi:hypothetical protein